MLLIFGFLNDALNGIYEASRTPNYNFTLRDLFNCSIEIFEDEFALPNEGRRTLKIPKYYNNHQNIVLGIGEDFFRLLFDRDFHKYEEKSYSNIRRDIHESEKIIIPDSVIKIHENAFSNKCKKYIPNVKTIVVPDSVTEIGTNAFEAIPHIEYHGSASGAPWGAKSMN